METALAFIIPVRHPKNSRNWPEQQRMLADTLRSIAAQTSGSWKAIVVANVDATLPPLPPGVSVRWVDFPPNTMHERRGIELEDFYDAVRWDKGRRVLAGMLDPNAAARYVMVVDDDDFVSRHLTSHAEQHAGHFGWYVDTGYLWDSGGRLISRYRDFSAFCGTSLIVRRDLYNLPDELDAADVGYVKTMLGSHIFIKEVLRSRTTPLAPLPFPGAIYRVGHTASHSNSSSLLKHLFYKRENLRKPAKLFERIASIRILNEHIRNEFGL